MKRNSNRFAYIILIFTLAACVSSSKKAPVQEAQKEIRLSEDRSKLESLRKNVPEETKTYNDEASFILNLFADDTKAPYQINSRFNELANRKREEYSKSERRRREDFNRDEKKKRDTYLDTLKRAREKQNLAKMSQQDRNRFFADQESEKRRHSSDESDVRRNFESKVRQDRQDFEAQMRDVRSRFDEEYRNYSKAFNERKKLKADQTRAAEKSKRETGVPAGFTEEDMKDLNSIPKSAKPIEPTENE